MEQNLLNFVISELQARRGQWVEIATDMGMAYGTIAKIGGGFTPNPRVKTVQRIADYLKGKKAA